MRTSKTNRRSTGLFSEHQLNLVYDQQKLSDFIGNSFSKAAIPDQIHKKRASYSNAQRIILVNALRKQYEGLDSDKVASQLQLLQKENTFTVTTGHQLSLFTGPLYFVIKILHVIKLAEELHALFPDNHFVPVYWMATEDHDYEEIKSCNLFNKTITWETDQTGPVGRFTLRDFENVISELKGLFGNNPDAEIIELLDQYKGKTYGEATRGLVHHMFNNKGLIIVDGDDEELKASLQPVVERELTEQFSNKAVTDTNKELERKGLPQQAYPREINLFYLDEDSRERIIKDTDGFKVKEAGYTVEEMIQISESHPERFSPNVMLRPLYQEIILPNIVYVGGAGEINYWLQLKGIFDAAEIPYPLISVRNSVIWIDRNTKKKMDKIGLEVNEVFLSAEELKKQYLAEHDEVDLDFSLLDASFGSLENELKSTILSTDPVLGNYAGAEVRRLEKILENVKAKLMKVEKSKHDQAMKIIDDVKEKLFPGNGIQERSVNFFSFCADGNYSYKLEELYNALDPFCGDLIILEDE